MNSSLTCAIVCRWPQHPIATCSSPAPFRSDRRWFCCMARAAMYTNSCHSQPMWRLDHRPLAMCGAVPLDDGHALFHRFPDRSVDEADITARTPLLVHFILAARNRYSFTKAPIAIGCSNGAIMAATLLLTRPKLLARIIMFRPLSPFTHDPPLVVVPASVIGC
jgi:predicted esterase